MKTIMEKISKASERLDRVNVRLDVVKSLYGMTNGNIISIVDGYSINESIVLVDILSNPYTTVTHVIYKKGGIHFPVHTHEESIEYLIVITGKLYIKFQEGASRVVMRGECVSIPRGSAHTGHALEDGTELIAVCVPPEPAYRFKETE